MPYLLPTDPEISELACVLVYYPNAPEYRQALFGQLAELSDVWNWEGTREQQALARVAWLAAELETINNMTCLDELLAEVQAINAKLPWCCDDGTGYSEGVEGGDGTVTIWPTPGPAPLPIPDTDFSTDDYPVTPVTDPDDDGIVTSTDWEQYLCGAVNYLVDSVIDYLRFVRFQRTFTSSFLGVIRWLQARIAGAIIPGAADDFALWELNDLIGEVINAFENVPITVIDNAITDLESIRLNIYCAILGENTAQNAIDAALTLIFGAVDNALAQSLIGNPVALFASLIWNGAIDVSWDTGCDCDGTTLNGYLRVNFGSLLFAPPGAGDMLPVKAGTYVFSTASTTQEGQLLQFGQIEFTVSDVNTTRVQNNIAYVAASDPVDYLSPGNHRNQLRFNPTQQGNGAYWSEGFMSGAAHALQTRNPNANPTTYTIVIS